MKHELSDIDPQKMNPQKMDSQKWDLLLDLLEHPEKYSETEKDELLGDEDVDELYQQLIETRQSLDFAKSKEEMKMPSIDAEWEKLIESAGVIESRSSGMKGTYIKVLNEVIFDELEEIKAQRNKKS